MNVSFMVSNVFSDHMVLQRNRPIRVNGFGTPFTIVRVELNGFFVDCEIGEDSTWEAVLPNMDAGGPYELIVTAQHNAEKRFKDIMVGDIWVCSGQSNMEYFVYNAMRPDHCLGDNGKKLCEEANDDKLRLLHVKHAVNYNECDMLPDGCAWHPATSFDAVSEMSAVGYLFGQHLRNKYPDIPIGIVSSSWGGSLIQPWIDEESLISAGETELVNTLNNARARQNSPQERAEQDLRRDATFFGWIDDFNAYAPEKSDYALKNWAKRDVDMSDWEEKSFRNLNLSNEVGIAWYRTIVDFSESFANHDVMVFFAAINDVDEVFFDDVKIGETTCHQPEWWTTPRKYMVDKALATPGKHSISVRVKNHCFTGGILGEAAIYVKDSYDKISLVDKVWYQKQEFVVDPDKLRQRPSEIPGAGNISTSVPTCLFNAMLKPLTKIDICGVLWYQGCSNAGEPANYYRYNKLLINAWRKLWRNPNMPFMITQLAAYQEQRPYNRLPDDYWKDFEPSNIGYQRLREVQKRIAEDMDNVGIAITIDIGDHSDIHPKNKYDVAKRLFACAEKIAYNEDVPYLCPDCVGVIEQDGGLLVKLNNVGAGLCLKGADEIGEHMFALAGENGVYKWATAKLVSKDEIFVYSSEVANPKTVRYAWSAFPPYTNIYSSDGLPLQPFRTDEEKVY